MASYFYSFHMIVKETIWGQDDSGGKSSRPSPLGNLANEENQ